MIDKLEKDGSLFPERAIKEISINDIDLPNTSHKIIIGDSRNMKELKENSVHLIITSPPYPMIEMWDSLFDLAQCETYDKMHNYLNETWKECYRVLIDGGIACINIGDATRKKDGMFRLYPNHAKIIENCEKIGFISLPFILWKKPTNKPNAFLGSGFIPTNAYVTLDCEYILIFRKGNLRKFLKKDPFRYASYYTKEERDRWFSQIWEVKGARQDNGQERRTAAFPEEIVYRLMRMFSVIGDTILDPFLGTGTTTKVAMQQNRNSIGYEISEGMVEIIQKKINMNQLMLTNQKQQIEIIKRNDLF